MRLDKRYTGFVLVGLLFIALAIFSGFKRTTRKEAPRKVVPCVVVEETVPFQNTLDS